MTSEIVVRSPYERLAWFGVVAPAAAVGLDISLAFVAINGDTRSRFIAGLGLIAMLAFVGLIALAVFPIRAAFGT